MRFGWCFPTGWRNVFGLRDSAKTKYSKRVLFLFFEAPHDSERVATFAGANESALLHRKAGVNADGGRHGSDLLGLAPRSSLRTPSARQQKAKRQPKKVAGASQHLAWPVNPNASNVAEREGFEPPIPVKVCPLSRRIVSTTHAPLLRAVIGLSKSADEERPTTNAAF
jgi:hypothetical protein